MSLHNVKINNFFHTLTILDRYLVSTHWLSWEKTVWDIFEKLNANRCNCFILWNALQVFTLCVSVPSNTLQIWSEVFYGMLWNSNARVLVNFEWEKFDESQNWGLRLWCLWMHRGDFISFKLWELLNFE